eukprot:TCONS_00017559-protein
MEYHENTLIVFLLITILSFHLGEPKIYETVKRTTQKGKCRTMKYEYTIRIEGCIPKTIKMKMCGGACESRVTGQSTSCSRCYPNSMREAETWLTCENGKKQKVKYLKLKNCHCQKMECKRWKPEDRLGFTR